MDSPDRYSELGPEMACRMDVYLFPDLSKDGKAFELWSSKALDLETRLPGTKFIVSDLLENKATEAEKKQGLDLADFLIRHDYKYFVKIQIKGREVEQPTIKQPNIPFDEYVNKLTIENKEPMAEGYPASWDLTAPYLDSKTKDFIKLVYRNSPVLELQQRLKLKLNTT